MSVYYNEHDRFAAAWLRELIRDGLIPAGDVDERDIQLVQPADLAGYTSCHFFAGIGGWSYALRLAEWPDDRPVWTGSCPCQPFSAAGKQEGFEDSRHLWPTWFRLIRECLPPVVFGEQVGGPDGYHWLDLVSTDMEEAGYAFGAADLAAASVGAPHIRQRLYFVADTERGASERLGQHLGVAPGATLGAEGERERVRPDAGDGGFPGVAQGDTNFQGPQGRGERRERASERAAGAAGDSGVGLADTNDGRLVQHSEQYGGQKQSRESASQRDDAGRCRQDAWSRVAYIPCRDRKYRPVPATAEGEVEPALFPLAHGLPNRVGALRGAGNAICAPLAAEFVRAYLQVKGDLPDWIEDRA